MVNGINKSGSVDNINSARSNWLSSLNWQFDFYRKASHRSRVDSEFDWKWLERYPRDLMGLSKAIIKSLLRRLNVSLPGGVSQEWVNKNSTLLWEARCLLEDDLSKLLFDNLLILRCSSYQQYYYPRIDFEDFASVKSEKLFHSEDMPVDYIGLPLKLFDLELRQEDGFLPLRVLSTKAQINLLNSYRQYFVRRGVMEITPVEGDVVLDCGACIGEISVLIARLVGTSGEVHLFDPVPLHARYCQLQGSLNPEISHVLRINTQAVSNVSGEIVGAKNDSSLISPSGLSVNSYSITSLDDYAERENLSRVNVIKMDIEGAEMAALEGAARIISTFKPRLAISTYHKPEDLWEIPQKIKEINPSYKLLFGHHSPISWESVYYAT